MADSAVTIHEHATPRALPPAALALLGQDAFSTPAWYAATLAAGLPDGGQPAFQVAWLGQRVLGVWPMLRQADGLRALVTPYTCLWRPLLHPDASQAELEAAGRALAASWRKAGVVRLDAMPAPDGAAQAVLRGLAAAGLRPLPFDHFGNWHEDVAGLGWGAYLAARPARLRTAIRRQGRRLAQQPGYAFSLVQGEAGLEAAIAAYETVYAASWKQPEPYPRFNAALMRACAADTTLRLGLIHLAGIPIAAQLWLVHRGWAGVLKLAYDETRKALAPGNVLTALMLRHVLEQDQVREIDFGRGDDDYKQMWAASRRQRGGVLVANPLSLVGALQIGRHRLGELRNTGSLLLMKASRHRQPE